MEKPKPGSYASFYQNYVSLSVEPRVELHEQIDFLNALSELLSEADGEFKYAENKWTIKALLQHCIDTERIFIYRFLRIVRGDKTPLPGFEQDDYINEKLISETKLSALIKDFISVRKASISLIELTPENYLQREGTMSGNNISAYALLFIMSGHCIHHFNILKERYLTKLKRG
jgi:uncharacterized damage-inducible protein DinB